jgi:membrane-associated phospholipid phosphatase
MPAWLDDAKTLDAAVYAAVSETRTPRLDVAMRDLSRAADHGKLWLGAAALLALGGGTPGRRAACRGLASLGLASAFANAVAKPLTVRSRPQRPEREALLAREVPMPSSSSFPSGHTASAFAFATGAGASLPLVSAPLRALATVVGYSRVHTGVHYPADVLVGAFIGVTAAEIASRLLGET